MQFPIRTQLSGRRSLVPVFAGRLVPLLLIVVQADQASLSLKDTVGSELISRVDVQQNAGLGDLSDASTDVDAPEQLELPAPPKQHALAPAELALIQDKTVHKEEVHKVTVKKKLVHKRSHQEPQEALAKAFEKSATQQSKSADADVEQLGGQLQNIMSDLNGQDSEKEESSGKQALQQANGMEDAADSGDEAAMEKEAAKDSGKDDSENVVDGAMAYIRTRLAAEEHKSLRLRQLLQQSVRGNKDMREKVGQLRKQLSEGAALQKNLRTVAAKKVAQEETELAKQTKRSDTLTKELQNATRAAKIGEKGMKVLGMRLKYSKSQVAALLLNLANASQQNKDLRRQLDATNTTAVSNTDELAKARKLGTRFCDRCGQFSPPQPRNVDLMI